MPLCTATEVFNFMQTGQADRGSANTAMITALIESVQAMIERYIGRKVTAFPIDISIHDGRYCSISGRFIFLNSFYFDILELTVTENGTELVEGTDYVIEKPNIIERINTMWNASTQLGIRLEGLVGLVEDVSDTDEAEYEALADIKQIAIECVAVKSGLWAKNVLDGQGNEMEVVRQQLPKLTMIQLDKYQIPIL